MNGKNRTARKDGIRTWRIKRRNRRGEQLKYYKIQKGMTHCKN